MTFFQSLKAFTLFTAMVSFIVIGIGVIVIQHISNSEQNYSQVISSLSNQQEMDATKDLIRLDSLVVFNVLYRAKFFDYFDNNCENCSGIYHSIDPLTDENWEVFKDGFIDETFFGKDTTTGTLGSKFAIYVANKMLSLLYDYSGNFKNQYFFRIYDYSIQKTKLAYISNSFASKDSLFDPGTVLSLTEGNLRQAFVDTIDLNHKFIMILNCIDQEDCKNGSFYTNLDITKVDFATYLNLPRVFVKRNLDNSAMDDSILSRNMISFFIPMRLFGAIAFARTELTQNTDLVNDLKDVVWGDNISSSNCTDFQGPSSEIESKIDKTEYNTALNDVLSKYVSEEDTTTKFRLNYDNILLQNSYKSKVFVLWNKSVNNSIMEFQQDKLESARFEVSVEDLDSVYSFGHNGFKFGFYGIVQVQEPSVNVTVCNCEEEPKGTYVCSGSQ